MSNSTSGGWSSVPQYVGYICEGVVIGGSNLLIVLSICRYEALRTSKVHFVMMSLALADFGNVFGFGIAGAWRIHTVLSGFHDHLESPWYCVTKPQTMIILVAGIHSSAFQLLVVSFDRLLATSWPLQYLGWSRHTYTYPLVGLSHAFTASTGLVGVALAYTQRHERSVKAACSTTRTVIGASKDAQLYLLYFTVAPVFFSLVSVFLYLLVWYNYKRGTVDDADVLRERRFTRTLGYSCFCTFFLYSVPLSLAFVARWANENSLGSFFFVMANFNAFMNLVIYQLHQPEMRMALFGLFTCKQMPIDLRQWKVNAAVAPTTTPRLVNPSFEPALDLQSA